MPQVRKAEENIIEVRLPSYGENDPAIAKINTYISVSDVLNIDESLSEKEKVMLLLVNRIKSWNLTNNGEPLPITEETIKELDTRDFIALMNAITTEKSDIDNEKKSD